MVDRIFGALLTFCLLAGATAAIGAAMFGHDRHAEARRMVATPQVVQLPTVEITAKRPALARSDSLEPTARRLQ